MRNSVKIKLREMESDRDKGRKEDTENEGGDTSREEGRQDGMWRV